MVQWVKNMTATRVPIMAQWLTNPARNHEVADLIPGLTQWVKDLALLSAVVWVADTAWILCCCGVGWQLQLRIDRYTGNLHMPWVRPWKRQKDKQTKHPNMIATAQVAAEAQGSVLGLEQWVKGSSIATAVT